LQRQFDVVIECDEEGCYVASVPQLPGCHKAVELCLEVEGALEQVLEFVGIQRISVAA
jgi:predicted RNase H-like HicB family nuclease